MKKAMMYISVCAIGFAMEFNLHDQIKIEYEKFQKKNKQDGKTPHQKCVAFIKSLMEENNINADKIAAILKGEVFPVTLDKAGKQKKELTELLEKHFQKYQNSYSDMILNLDENNPHQNKIKEIYEKTNVNDQAIKGAGVTLVAKGPDKKIYFLLAKQNHTFGGELTNFGGLKDSGETPEVAASKELEEESCGAYKISPEELRKCVYVDSGYFRTYTPRK